MKLVLVVEYNNEANPIEDIEIISDEGYLYEQEGYDIVMKLLHDWTADFCSSNNCICFQDGYEAGKEGY